MKGVSSFFHISVIVINKYYSSVSRGSKPYRKKGRPPDSDTYKNPGTSDRKTTYRTRDPPVSS